MPSQRIARSAQDGRTTRLARIFGCVVLIAAWMFAVASLIGFDRADPPSHLVFPHNDPVVNWCGPLGALVAYSSFKFLGYASWLPAICITIGLMSAAIGRSVQHALVRFIGLVMLTGAIAGLQNLLLPNSGPMPDLAGGVVGTVTVSELSMRFGGLGTGIVLAVFSVVGAVVAMDEWVIAFFGWVWRVTRDHGVPAAQVAGVAAGGAALNASSAAAKVSGNFLVDSFRSLFSGVFTKKKRTPRQTDLEDEDLSPSRTQRRAAAKAAKLAKPDAIEIEDPDLPLPPPTAATALMPDPAATDEEATPARGRRKKKTDATPLLVPVEGESDEDEAAPTKRTPAAPEEEDDEEEAAGAPQVFDAEALKAKMAKLPIIFGNEHKRIATDADLAAMQSEGNNAEDETTKPYKFPGLDLLEIPEENFSDTLKAHVETQGAALMAALQEYRIEGRVVDAESGPAVTMYNVKLAPGTKVAALQTVQSDIARSLRAINVRIVTNIAGRDTIGIEVPNTTREKVRLKELMGHTEVFTKMKLPMFLGKDAGGAPLIQDLAKMPHMLIAGTTGSGKSVCMNTIIMGFLYTKRPSELKLILVDPKMVEMSQFKDIPHLMCPVVTEMPKAAAILEWACHKMEERYATLQEAGCRDIGAYNELSWEELKERLSPGSPEEEARIPRKLPYIVIVIDELADLMMTNREVEGSIIRIAQKARAVGIHLILATQRPQREVVTGLIKANMPARMTFKVSSGMDSRIVLDHKGGELLLGQGDMLFLTPSSSQIMRAQGTLVDDREIRRVVKFMKEVAAPSFERSLMQIRAVDSDQQRLEDSMNNSSASLEAAKEDPLFNRAVEIVLESKRGSVSLLQRRLAIGYTRASRLVDLMGIAGIISDHKGSVARDVLITLEEWQAMRILMEEQAKAQGITLPTEDAATATQAALFDDGSPDMPESEQDPEVDLPPPQPAKRQQQFADAKPDPRFEEPPFDADDV